MTIVNYSIAIIFPIFLNFNIYRINNNMLFTPILILTLQFFIELNSSL